MTIREAVAAECVALASPLKLAGEKADNAAARAQAAAKAVNWLWLTSALLLGGGGHWYFVSKDLKTVRDYAAEKAKPKSE